MQADDLGSSLCSHTQSLTHTLHWVVSVDVHSVVGSKTGSMSSSGKHFSEELAGGRS